MSKKGCNMDLLKLIISVLTGFIGWLVGGWTLLLSVLFILNIIDYATGITAAALYGKISSKQGLKGIVKKIMIWVWVAVANLVYMTTNHLGLDLGQILPNAVAVLFIINEVVSIGENSGKLGYPVPEPIAHALEVFNKTKEKDVR